MTRTDGKREHHGADLLEGGRFDGVVSVPDVGIVEHRHEDGDGVYRGQDIERHSCQERRDGRRASEIFATTGMGHRVSTRGAVRKVGDRVRVNTHVEK